MSVVAAYHMFVCALFLVQRGMWTAVHIPLCTCKRKAVSLQAWSGPEGFRKLRFPDFTATAHNVGKVVSLRNRPPLPPGNKPGTHFY